MSTHILFLSYELYPIQKSIKLKALLLIDIGWKYISGYSILSMNIPLKYVLMQTKIFCLTLSGTLTIYKFFLTLKMKGGEYFLSVWENKTTKFISVIWLNQHTEKTIAFFSKLNTSNFPICAIFVRLEKY